MRQTQARIKRMQLHPRNIFNDPMPICTQCKQNWITPGYDWCDRCLGYGDGYRVEVFVSRSRKKLKGGVRKKYSYVIYKNGNRDGRGGIERNSRLDAMVDAIYAHGVCQGEYRRLDDLIKRSIVAR